MSSAPFDRMLSIALMLAGAAAAFCGAVAGTVWRREGVTIRALFWAGSAAAAHPERYVRADRVLIVRTLHVVGATLCVAGVLVLVGRSLWRLS